MTLMLALSYGGRQDIVEAAARRQCAPARAWCCPKRLTRASSTPRDDHPHAARRGSADSHRGRSRLSDFLLYEAAYAELVFLPIMWPDFKPTTLLESVELFSQRAALRPDLGSGGARRGRGLRSARSRRSESAGEGAMKAVFVLGSSLALLAGCSRDGRGASGPPGGEGEAATPPSSPPARSRSALAPHGSSPAGTRSTIESTRRGRPWRATAKVAIRATVGPLALARTLQRIHRQRAARASRAELSAGRARGAPFRDLGPTGLGIAIGQDPGLELRQSE